LETTILTIDGKEAHLNCIGTGEGHRLNEWKDTFFPELIKNCNLGPGSECSIAFYGLESDFDDLFASCTAYLETEKGIVISLNYKTNPPVTLNSVQEQLQQLLITMQKGTPINGFDKNEYPIEKYGAVEEITNIIKKLRGDMTGLGADGKIEKLLLQKKEAVEIIIVDIDKLEKKERERLTAGIDEVEKGIVNEQIGFRENLNQLAIDGISVLNDSIDSIKRESVFKPIEMEENNENHAPGNASILGWHSIYSEPIPQNKNIPMHRLIKDIYENASKELQDVFAKSSSSSPSFTLKDIQTMFSHGYTEGRDEFCSKLEQGIFGEFDKVRLCLTDNVKNKANQYYAAFKAHVFNLVYQGFYYGDKNVVQTLHSDDAEIFFKQILTDIDTKIAMLGTPIKNIHIKIPVRKPELIEFYDEAQPIFEQFCEQAGKYVVNSINELKNYFDSAMIKLDDAVKECYGSMLEREKKLFDEGIIEKKKEKQALEKEVADLEAKAIWLGSFGQKLEAVLEI
jgi:hypothetical protein